MTKTSLIPIFLIAVFLISACASTPDLIHTPPTLEGDWHIRMIQTGGIAGVNHALEVLSDGSYKVYQQAGAEGIQRQLSQTDLANLENLIANLEIRISGPNGVCADCFIYDIEIQSGGRKMTFQLDDISLRDSGASELVMFLSGLMR